MVFLGAHFPPRKKWSPENGCIMWAVLGHPNFLCFDAHLSVLDPRSLTAKAPESHGGTGRRRLPFLCGFGNFSGLNSLLNLWEGNHDFICRARSFRGEDVACGNLFQESIMEFFKEHAVKGKTDTEIVKVKAAWIGLRWMSCGGY